MRAIRTFAILGIAALYLAGCQQEQAAQPAPPPPEVTVTQPVRKQIVQWDRYTGRLAAVQLVEVRPRVSGYLKSIHFDEGQMVKQGDLLFVIDPRPFEAALNSVTAQLEEAQAKVEQAKSIFGQRQAELKQAEAALDLAKKRLERSDVLLKRNAVSPEEGDIRESEYLQAQADVAASQANLAAAKAGISTAEAAVETAQAAIENARLDLSYTQLRAPISGRVSKWQVTEGNLVSGGSGQSTLLTTIVSTDPIHCYFDADEQAVLKYTRLAEQGKRQSSREVKNPVYLSLADEKGFPHKGHMDFVDNRLDPNTGTMRARAIFSNPDNVLTPGMFAQIRIPGTAPHEAILIPDEAIATDQSEKFVYAIDDKGVAKRIPVTVGETVDGLRVVESGLTGSETIVTHGLQLVRDGATVTTKVEQVVAVDDGLPDNYSPVPEIEWLSSRANISGNATEQQRQSWMPVTITKKYVDQPHAADTRIGSPNSL